MLRIVMRVFGVAACAIGVIWILQGFNILPGSFMTGDINWAYRGGLLVILGFAIVYFAMRKPPSQT